MKKHNTITYIFLGTIFLFMIMYPVMFVLIHFGIVKPEFSNFYTVIKPTGNIINRLDTKFTNIKNNINNKLTNYLFLYSQVNSMYPKVKSSINFYSNNFRPLGTNTDGEYIFFNSDGYYILQSNKDNNYIDSKMNDAINFYNKLSENNELYIYLPSRYEFQEFNNVYTFRNMDDLKNEFIDSLNDKIIVSELNVKDEKMYQELFYHTDHHWNAYGAYQGYQDICNMLNIQANSYNITKTNLKYHGSIGKMVADKNTFDYFTYVDNTDEIKATIDGKDVPSNFKPRKLKTDKGVFYDQYVGFYDGLYPEVVYEGRGEENLLILGDSYAWQIDYLIANKFNHTYVLNPKYVENMDLDKYLKDKNINKILVLMETQTTIFDNYGYDYVTKLGG